MQRRTVLKLGLVGGALVAVGGIGVALLPSARIEPRRPLQVLDSWEFAVIALVADRMFEGPGLPAARDLEIAEGVDALLATMHPSTTAEVRQVLVLLESSVAGLFMHGRLGTFSTSSPEAQRAVLRSWASSRWTTLRTAYRALHGLCMGVAWSNPAMHEIMGYPGPPQGLSALVASPGEATAGEVEPAEPEGP
ncbi:MAG: hypothetical protein EA397_09435 [Deltaproteobacteria bacterium]|nr:MAG: hypothetical protein EA397_09435 [Deltaproteobacteria bacterium]